MKKPLKDLMPDTLPKCNVDDVANTAVFILSNNITGQIIGEMEVINFESIMNIFGLSDFNYGCTGLNLALSEVNNVQPIFILIKISLTNYQSMTQELPFFTKNYLRLIKN